MTTHLVIKVRFKRGAALLYRFRLRHYIGQAIRRNGRGRNNTVGHQPIFTTHLARSTTGNLLTQRQPRILHPLLHGSSQGYIHPLCFTVGTFHKQLRLHTKGRLMIQLKRAFKSLGTVSSGYNHRGKLPGYCSIGGCQYRSKHNHPGRSKSHSTQIHFHIQFQHIVILSHPGFTKRDTPLIFVLRKQKACTQ